MKKTIHLKNGDLARLMILMVNMAKWGIPFSLSCLNRKNLRMLASPTKVYHQELTNLAVSFARKDSAGELVVGPQGITPEDPEAYSAALNDLNSQVSRYDVMTMEIPSFDFVVPEEFGEDISTYIDSFIIL